MQKKNEKLVEKLALALAETESWETVQKVATYIHKKQKSGSFECGGF